MENWDSKKLNGNRGLHSSQGTPLCKTASSPKTITRRVQQGAYMGVPLSNRGQGASRRHQGDCRGPRAKPLGSRNGTFPEAP